MFFIRASGTDFYKIILCRKNKNTNIDQNRISSNRLLHALDYVNPEEPLTVMISKSINFEFITCILFGLSIIFEKIGKKSNANKNMNDSSVNETYISNRKAEDSQMISFMGVSQFGSHEKLFDNKKYKYIIVRKTFISMKKHIVYYEKTDSYLDIKVNYDFTNSFHSSSEELKEDYSNVQEKQDGIIIEHFPKIFKFIRDQDKISTSELLR